MDLLDALVLGAVQGLTEFLPVSSSGHLVIFQKLLGVKGDTLFLTVFFHSGSLCALVLLFRKTLWELFRGFLFHGGYYRSLGWGIIGALIPTAIFGLLLEEKVETLPIRDVGFFYLLTAFFLLSLRYLKGIRDLEDISFKDGFLIGIAQGAGVFPGLSRSGVTIFGGAFTGFRIDSAIRFSFLLAIPTIAGALLLEIRGFSAFKGELDWLCLSVGFVSSFFFSLFAIKFLLVPLVQKKIHWFSLYCLLLGVILIFWS